MVDGGQAVGFPDAVGDEGCIVDALGQVAFIAGKQQHMLKVEITRFQNAHDLDAFDGFSVEGNTRSGDNLCDQALQGDDVDEEDSAVDEVAETIQQGVHPEQAFLSQRRQCHFVGAESFGNLADERHEPEEQVVVEALRLVVRHGEEQLESFVLGELRRIGIVDLLCVQLFIKTTAKIRNIVRIRMLQHEAHLTEPVVACLCDIAVCLETDEQIDQRGHRCL